MQIFLSMISIFFWIEKTNILSKLNIINTLEKKYFHHTQMHEVHKWLHSAMNKKKIKWKTISFTSFRYFILYSQFLSFPKLIYLLLPEINKQWEKEGHTQYSQNRTIDIQRTVVYQHDDDSFVHYRCILVFMWFGLNKRKNKKNLRKKPKNQRIA